MVCPDGYENPPSLIHFQEGLVLLTIYFIPFINKTPSIVFIKTYLKSDNFFVLIKGISDIKRTIITPMLEPISVITYKKLVTGLHFSLINKLNAAPSILLVFKVITR